MGTSIFGAPTVPDSRSRRQGNERTSTGYPPGRTVSIRCFFPSEGFSFQFPPESSRVCAFSRKSWRCASALVIHIRGVGSDEPLSIRIDHPRAWSICEELSAARKLRLKEKGRPGGESLREEESLQVRRPKSPRNSAARMILVREFVRSTGSGAGREGRRPDRHVARKGALKAVLGLRPQDGRDAALLGRGASPLWRVDCLRDLNDARNLVRRAASSEVRPVRKAVATVMGPS